jgi:hypothetical protein
MNAGQNLGRRMNATGERSAPLRSGAIRIGILVAGALAVAFLCLLAKSPVIQEQRAKGLHPFANSALFLAFLLLPYLMALGLVGNSLRRDFVASGAGVSLALFGVLLLGAPHSVLLVFTWAGLSGNPYLFKGLVVLIAFFADAGWVVWCSFRLGKSSPTRFLTAACITGAYLGVGLPAIGLREFRSAQQQEKQRTAETMSSWQHRDAARSAVESLTGCLIQYREKQPGGEFPASLVDLPAGLRLPTGKVCNSSLAKPGLLSDYTITYTPEPDPASGKITDFRVLAMPGRKGLDYVNPMLSDSRGRIFVYERWSATEQGEHLEPLLTEQPDDWGASRVFALRSDIRFAMKNKGMERPPSSLSELQLSTSTEGPAGSSDILNEGPYTVQYLAPRPGFSSGFALSAVCQSYGDKCIRSFFLDYDGDIHQATEARPATTDDPLIPDCEKYAQGCRDVDWPVP